MKQTGVNEGMESLGGGNKDVVKNLEKNDKLKTLEKSDLDLQKVFNLQEITKKDGVYIAKIKMVNGDFYYQTLPGTINGEGRSKRLVIQQDGSQNIEKYEKKEDFGVKYDVYETIVPNCGQPYTEGTKEVYWNCANGGDDVAKVMQYNSNGKKPLDAKYIKTADREGVIVKRPQ